MGMDLASVGGGVWVPPARAAAWRAFVRPCARGQKAGASEPAPGQGGVALRPGRRFPPAAAGLTLQVWPAVRLMIALFSTAFTTLRPLPSLGSGAGIYLVRLGLLLGGFAGFGRPAARGSGSPLA